MSALLRDGAGLGPVLAQLEALRIVVMMLRSHALSWRTASLVGQRHVGDLDAAIVLLEARCYSARLAAVLHEQGVRGVVALCRAQLVREERYTRAVAGPLVLERWGHLGQAVSDSAARLEQLLDETEAEIDQLLGRRAA